MQNALEICDTDTLIFHKRRPNSHLLIFLLAHCGKCYQHMQKHASLAKICNRLLY